MERSVLKWKRIWSWTQCWIGHSTLKCQKTRSIISFLIETNKKKFGGNVQKHSIVINMKCILSERLLSPYKVFHKIICIELSLSIFYCTHPVWMLMSDRWVAGRRQSGLTVHAVKHITEMEGARALLTRLTRGPLKHPNTLPQFYSSLS